MTKAIRGFACLDIEARRAIASQGGKAAHAQGRAHEWTSSEAREAGRKGGKALRRKSGKLSENDGVHGPVKTEE